MVQLNVGDIFRTTTEVIAKNLGTFIALIAIIALPRFVIEIGASLLGTHLLPGLVATAGGASPFDTIFANLVVILPLAVIAIVVVVFTYVVAQAGMTYTTVEHMAGRRPDVGNAVSAGFRSIGSLLVGGLLVGLVTGLGALLCLVPGIIAALFLCLTTPAILAERLGPVEGMERSAALTDGHKVTIFIVFVVLFGLGILNNEIVSRLVAGVMALDETDTASIGFDPVWMAMSLVGFVAHATLSAFGTTTIAVIYARIRGIREGMDTAAYASVFA